MIYKVCFLERSSRTGRPIRRAITITAENATQAEAAAKRKRPNGYRYRAIRCMNDDEVLQLKI